MDVYKDWLGIPEGPRPPDHYALLRLVLFEDNTEKIRANYKKLNAHVRKYATGQYSVESQALLNELAKAMLCLTDEERKREYDESLGREFEEAYDPLGRQPLEKTLVEKGIITREQMKEAQAFADARGLSMRDAVVQLKLTDVETATQAYAAELGRPYIDLADTTPDDNMLDLLPRSVVKRNMIVPLFEDDGMLLVACAHEPEHELEEELRLRYGMPMRAVMATPLAVNQAIAEYYKPGMRDEAKAAANPRESAAKGSSRTSKPAKSQSSAARVPMSKLSPEQARERRQIGILIMCWSIIIPVLFDQFVLRAILVPRWTFLLATSLVAPPIAIWWVLKSYWK